MTTKWPEVALGDVASIVMGQAPKGDTYNDQRVGWPLIAGAGDFGRGVPCAKKFTTAPTRLSVPGDIVLGIRASIGEKVLADGEYCLGRGVAGLRGGTSLDARYLWHWLSSSASSLAAKGRGATFLQVNRSDIAEMPIPLPPVEEQRRIAAILDAADELRAKRRRSLALLESLAEASFLDMFGNPLRRPPHPMMRLSELGVVTTGKTPPTASEGMFGGLIPFVTPGDLESGAEAVRTLTNTGAAASRVVRAGATLVCCIGATIGKVGFVGEPSAFNQQINAVEWGERIADDYGLVLLKRLRPLIRARGASTTLPLLNKTDFSAIEVPVPPIDLQKDFGRICERLRRHRLVLQTPTEQGDALFTSLQHRAFRGEL